jgi:hypothetical protein
MIDPEPVLCARRSGTNRRDRTAVTLSASAESVTMCAIWISPTSSMAKPPFAERHLDALDQRQRDLQRLGVRRRIGERCLKIGDLLA